MKEIVFAGERGTNLYPLTQCIFRHLLKVYNKSMGFDSVALFLGDNLFNGKGFVTLLKRQKIFDKQEN